jgi:hypothetical protein
LFLAGDHPEEGRLARAVWADHAHDPAAWQGEVDVVHQQHIAVRLAQVAGFHDDVASRGPGGMKISTESIFWA